MLANAVRTVLLRELRAVRRALEAYPDDAAPWTEVPGMANTGGTLALHIAGNLRHFIGRGLGSTDFVRDRPAEFARRDVPRAELIAGIDAAMADVERGLDAASDAVLAAPWPEPINDRRVTAGDFLVHLAVHLAWHLGQLDTHRRVVTGEGTSIGAVSPNELAAAH